MIGAPPGSTFFPYPPLFRSPVLDHVGRARHGFRLRRRQRRISAIVAREFRRIRARTSWPATTPPIQALVACLDIERLSRSEEHTSELQSQSNLVCRLLLVKQ